MDTVMAFEQRQVLINKIYLDPENPRHEMLPDEPAIIRHLMQKERVRNLAKNISEAGGISPLEIIALIEHPRVKNGYVVVEGNRRVCALKLLRDPQKAGAEKDVRYFQGLARNMRSPITRVAGMVFESRDEANRWFALRHNGEQEGVGTRAWDPNQIARFTMRNSGRSPNGQAAQVIDYVKKNGLLSANELESLSITTITRYLSNPIMRHALGLANGNNLEILVPDVEFERALLRFLRDSLVPEQTGVSSRSSADDRKAYAAQLTKEGVAAFTFGVSSHLPRQGGDAEAPITEGVVIDLEQRTVEQNAESKQESTGVAQIRDNRNPDRRGFVVPSSFAVKIKNKTLKRLYDELKSIDPTVHAFAATYLLRAVMEKSITVFLEQKGALMKERFLHEKIKKLIKLLADEGMGDRELKFLRTVATNGADDPFSPDSLGHFVHGGSIPTSTYVYRYWDNIEAVMRRVLSAV